jgi:hypothetical protein
MLKAVPAVAEGGTAPKTNVLAPAGLTVMFGVVTLRLLPASATVMDCEPAVSRVSVKVWLPLSVAVKV